MNGTSKYSLVMLIDDNEMDIFVNKQLIETENFATGIIAHGSAQGALEYLKNHAADADKIPNLIFLDIMMPSMDGFGFLAEFEKLHDDIKRKSKVVMLSTSESFKDLNRANQNRYVYKFLNKPLKREVLLALNV